MLPMSQALFYLIITGCNLINIFIKSNLSKDELKIKNASTFQLKRRSIF